MLIPLGTDRPSLRPMLITPVLLSLNIAAFVGQQVVQARAADEQEYWKLLDPFLLHPEGFRWFQPLTSAFLHADIWHIVGNMLFLWVFGPSIEDRLGRWWFLLFYLCGAFAAAGLHIALSDVPALGASGAIAALTGSFLVLFPRTQVKVLFILWFGMSWVSAWWFIGLGILWDLIGQAAGGSGVAHGAHLGGVAFGASVGVTLLALKWLPREPYDLFTMARQAKRRRELRELTLGQQRRMEKHWKNAKRLGGEGSAADNGSGTQGRGVSGANGTGSMSSADALALRRAEVSEFLAKEQLAEAAAAYKRLVEAHADSPAATTLTFRSQELLATHYYANGDHEAAAYAAERLVEAYPKQNGVPRFRLLLGLIYARKLNDPVRAKAMLKAALEDLHDSGERELAERELKDLG